MNQQRILHTFAEYFQPDRKFAQKPDAKGAAQFAVSITNPESILKDLDKGAECLGQIPGSTFRAHASFHLSGLYFGCPLSNDRRQLTSHALIWCPGGWPNPSIDQSSGQFVSLASSRLGNRLHHDSEIADGLRNFLLLADPDDVIVSAADTTMDGPLRRGCQLFDRHLLRLIPFPKVVSYNWIAQSISNPMFVTTTGPTPKGVQGSADFAQLKTTCVYFDPATISADELAFAISDTVKVLHLRKSGKILQLIERFLITSDDPHASPPGPTIMLRVTREHAECKTHQRLRAAGCIGWYLCPRDPVEASLRDGESTGAGVTSPRPTTNRFIDIRQLKEAEKFVSHWTRAERRPWPDQSDLNQYDQLLIHQRLEHDRFSPLETLCRILVQQKLLAGGRLVRSGHRVVCFTAVPLDQFAKRRIFRPQLSRWDFEPFGISIRQSVLQRLGGRSVQYVPSLASALHGTDLQQPPIDVFTVVNSPDSKVDWSQEREWRAVGDIDLRQLDSNDAVVFVPDEASANVVAGFSRWPIVILSPSLADSCVDDPSEIRPDSFPVS